MYHDTSLGNVVYKLYGGKRYLWVWICAIKWRRFYSNALNKILFQSSLKNCSMYKNDP